MTMTYSTQYKIRELGLTGIVSPPLSHSSDIAFLEWKRACDKSQTDLKSLKHIFISSIVTPSTQDIVATILKDMGKPITTKDDVWGKQLPGWAQKLTIQSDSDEGKAILGTVQLKGIMWMLVQHREHLGRKAVRSISIFRGNSAATALGGVQGPTFYIELEDLQSGAVAGPSGSAQSGSKQSGSQQQSGSKQSGSQQQSGSKQSGSQQSGSKQSGSKQSGSKQS
jgi:hypothetical protein